MELHSNSDSSLSSFLTRQSSYFLPLLVIALWICLHYADVLFGLRTLNTLPYSPAAQPYTIQPSGGWLAGTMLDRFPAGMTADRAFWDRPMVYDPNFLATHRSLLSGEFPWLNPSLALGSPLFANGVDGTFFIGNLVMALTSSDQWDYIYLALYLISGWMIYSILHGGFSLPKSSSLAGALVYLSSGLFVPQLGYGSEIWNIHIFSWCLYFLEKFLRAKTFTWRSLFGVALVFSLTQSCYAGMPEGTVAVFCMVGLFFLVRAGLTGNLFVARIPNLVTIVWGFFIFGTALLLASPYLVTLFYYSTMMPHGHEVGGLGLPLRLLPGLFLPYLHGWELHHFFGPELGGKVNVVFVGILPVVTSVLLLSRPLRSSGRGLEIGIFSVVALWYLSQSFTTPDLTLNFIGMFPVLNKIFFFRFFAPLFVFSAAYLVAVGTTRFVSDHSASPSWLVVALLWGVCTLATLWISLEASVVLPGTPPLAGAEAFYSWNGVHLYLLVLISLWFTADKVLSSFGSTTTFRLRPIILFAVTVISTSSHFSKSFFSRQDAAAPTPYLSYLQQKSSPLKPLRIYSHDLLFPGTASSYGLEDIRHMNPVVPATFAQFTSSIFGELAKGKVSWERFEQLHETGGATSYSHPAFDLLNVRFFVFPPQSQHIPIGPQFEEVFRDAQAVIVRNKDARPRAWLTKEFLSLGSDEAVLKEIERNPAQALTTALLAEEPRWVTLSEEPSKHPASAKIVARTNSSYQLSISLKEKQLLVIADLYLPGYRAYGVSPVGGDQVELPVYKVDGGLIGVAVPRGEYSVEVRYTPPVTMLSCSLFGTGLCIVIGVLGFALHRTNAICFSPLAARAKGTM